MKKLLPVLLLLIAATASAQQIKVEADKKRDLSKYKTFRFGEGQITTPKEQRVVADATIHGWIQQAVTEELTEKGLTKSDSGDLVVSYLTGVEKISEPVNVGPLGMTPGSTTQSYLHDYQQGNLVIDLNDARNNMLIWRVSATTQSGQGEADKVIDEIVEKGFKKFSIKKKK